RELVRGGVAATVREHGPLEGAAALVYVLAGAPEADDEKVLKEAARKRAPIVAVAVGHNSSHVPYVLEPNIVRVGSGTRFPVEEIARRLARVLGESGTPLAARLPVLRRAVCEELIRTLSRQNAIVGVAVIIPGADLPVLTLNQIRLVLRIADAYGFE